MKLDELIGNVAAYVNDAIIITEAAPLDETAGGPRIVYVNPAFTAMSGYAASEVMGRTPRLLQGPETSPITRAEIRTALERGEGISTDILNFRKDGTPYWIETSIRPVPGADGRPAFFVAVQRDVSERRELQDSLELARRDAAVASRAKSNFLSHMSHELRTPLNAIIGFAEMINREVLGPVGNPRYAEYAADIHLSGEFLLNVVNDILDFAKIEAGRIEMNETEIDFGSMLDEVSRITAGLALRLDVELTVDGAAGFRLQGDPRLLQQVFINLISNALRFTPKGGRVAVSVLLLADGRLACVVTDNGSGMPHNKTLDVLEPFVTLKGDRGTAQSTGLGLPICKAFVEFHGGLLFINSELGAGTSVYVTLPARRILARPPRVEAAEAGALTALETTLPDDVESLSNADLDRLPIGVLLLRRDGTVLRYNATESRFSGLLPEEVLGRNFFTEVAPCTSFSELRSGFESGLTAGTLNAVLYHTFRFPNRDMRVLVQMRVARDPDCGWLFVRWL
ncbi:MAG: ATP-binding protein [Ferrovibrio sp.]